MGFHFLFKSALSFESDYVPVLPQIGPVFTIADSDVMNACIKARLIFNRQRP